MWHEVENARYAHLGDLVLLALLLAAVGAPHMEALVHRVALPEGQSLTPLHSEAHVTRGGMEPSILNIEVKRAGGLGGLTLLHWKISSQVCVCAPPNLCSALQLPPPTWRVPRQRPAMPACRGHTCGPGCMCSKYAFPVMLVNVYNQHFHKLLHLAGAISFESQSKYQERVC